MRDGQNGRGGRRPSARRRRSGRRKASSCKNAGVGTESVGMGVWRAKECWPNATKRYGKAGHARPLLLSPIFLRSRETLGRTIILSSPSPGASPSPTLPPLAFPSVLCARTVLVAPHVWEDSPSSWVMRCRQKLEPAASTVRRLVPAVVRRAVSWACHDCVPPWRARWLTRAGWAETRAQTG